MNPDPGAPAGDTLPPPEDATKGGTKAVCVRTCDGGFFPVSYAANRGNTGNLEELCHALCPNAETQLFTYSPSRDIDTAVSVSGQSYMSLPNALKYRTKFDPACTCKPPNQGWAQALGNAEQLLGDRGRAERLFAAAAETLNAEPTSRFARPDYGSRLRDGAALLALAAEANVTAPISRAALIVQNEQAATATSSTQEQAWMVLAAEALAKQNDGLALEVSGVPQNGAFLRGWRGESLDAAPVTIVNRGRAPVQASITTSGAPIVADPAMNQGYSIERGLYSFSGEKIAVASLKQNERAIVVLKVTELEAAYARLMLVDRLSAGLEIDNPDLFDGGNVDGLAWIKSDITPVHTEYKDDRFAAAYDRNGADKATFAVAYVVRAVTPGRYVQPPASIEDMYRPSRFGRTAAGTFEVREK
eukprot:gene25905-28231_t